MLYFTDTTTMDEKMFAEGAALYKDAGAMGNPCATSIQLPDFTCLVSAIPVGSSHNKIYCGIVEALLYPVTVVPLN